MKDTFCAVPWTQLSTKPNGNIRGCCLMSNSEDSDKGVLRNPEGQIFNAKNANINEAFNAQKICQLRKDLMNGVQNPLCKTCWDKEAIGLKSKRITTNKMYRREIESNTFIQTTSAEGKLSEIKISYLDLRFGNKCNLKCIMCHPASSSKWYKDYNKIFDQDYFYDTGEKIFFDKSKNLDLIGDYDWYEQDSIWEQLNEHLTNIKQIYLVGGEPLLIPQHFKFLQLLIEKDCAKNITLEYDTNLTILDEKILKIWKPFKKVILRASIDSIELQNNYIRYPSQWDKISENLNVVSGLDNVRLNFSITWQIYNAFSVTDIWQKYSHLGSVRTLSSPKYLDIKILPKPLKQEIYSHLENFESSSEQIQQQIESMKKYVSQHMESFDPKLLQQFFEYTHKVDQNRKLKFPDCFPRLHKLLKPYSSN